MTWASVKSAIDHKGFAVVPDCLDDRMLGTLCLTLGDTKHAQRNLLDIPEVRALAVSEPVKQLAAIILGERCFAVRGMFFNKTPASNWKVVWHQDKTISVRERKDVAHFGPWSVKAGVPHVQPPALVMAKMLAIRLHLDESHEGNGPLRVIPGSHAVGCLSAQEIETWKARPSFICTVPKGGAILMRPLLVHASSSASKPEKRRVIHIEFASEDLPETLEWYSRV